MEKRILVFVDIAKKRAVVEYLVFETLQQLIKARMVCGMYVIDYDDDERNKIPTIEDFADDCNNEEIDLDEVWTGIVTLSEEEYNEIYKTLKHW